MTAETKKRKPRIIIRGLRKCIRGYLQDIRHIALAVRLMIRKLVDVVISSELINSRLIVFIFIALDDLRAPEVQKCVVAMSVSVPY